MIANLPLLFAGGSPTSLRKMSLHELECFITFLVHCSWGHDTAKVIQQPQWWSTRIPFTDPFIRPKEIPKDWSTRLRDLIRQCYAFHNSEFLLKFSEELSRNPPSTLQYVDNCDRTTSLYQRSSGRLLVTFRNENMLYDRKNEVSCRKSLLPKRQTPSESMVEQVIEDCIYLCDTCDEKFTNLKDVKEHELTCSVQRSSSPDLSRLSPEPCESVEVGQDEFMHILGLLSSSVSMTSSAPSDDNDKRNLLKNHRSRRSTLFSNLTHFPFSSLAGRKLLKNYNINYTEVRQRLERHCPAPPLSQESPRWLLKPRPTCFATKYKKTDNYWSRYQVFPKQRNKLMLDVKSQLLLLDCKPLNVRVKRITDKEIQDYMDELKRLHLARPVIVKTESFATVESLCENEIEFVSVSDCAKTSKKAVAAKRPHVQRNQSNSSKKHSIGKGAETSKVNTQIDIIDLCSDDDDECGASEKENPAAVACHASGEVSLQNLPVATTPELHSAEPPGHLEAAHYPRVKPGKNSQCVSDCEQKLANTFPLKEFHVNLHRTQINSVILID